MADEKAPTAPGVRRLVHIMGMQVRSASGTPLGQVNDVRLAPGQRVTGVMAELLVEGLVVARRHTGSMLGYDRRVEQGPWLVRRLVRRLHRHTGYLPIGAVTGIDWDERVVHSSVDALDRLERRAGP